MKQHYLSQPSLLFAATGAAMQGQTSQEVADLTTLPKQKLSESLALAV